MIISPHKSFLYGISCMHGQAWSTEALLTESCRIFAIAIDAWTFSAIQEGIAYAIILLCLVQSFTKGIKLRPLFAYKLARMYTVEFLNLEFILWYSWSFTPFLYVWLDKVQRKTGAHFCELFWGSVYTIKFYFLLYI